MDIITQKVAVIDLDSVSFSAAHPNKVFDEHNIPIRVNNKFVYEDKTEEEMITSANQIMDSILTKTRSTHYIAYIKGKGNYRYAVNPDYKANRHKDSPHWWKLLKEHFIQGWGATEVNGIEVDDAVNITRLNVPGAFITAIDGDLLGLEGYHYNWRKNQWIDVSKEGAKYKFWSDMITGQVGDNVKGIPGKGPKAASIIMEGIKCPPARILKNYVEYFGEDKGIKEFYKNYISLKLLENYEGFQIPDLVPVSKKSDDII